MTRISELATNFEQQSKRLASDTEQAIQSALQEHEQRLRKVLESSAKKTTDAIQQTEQSMLQHQRRLRRLMFAAWLLPIATMLVVQCGLLVGLWWTGSQVVSNAQELRQARALGIEYIQVGDQDALLLPSGATATLRETRDGRTGVIIRR